MRALLLAAGLGTRLRPITDTVPKCLVPVQGVPLIDYWLDMLLEGGLERALVNTHYLSDAVRIHLDRSPWRSRVDTVYEETLLGTGGTILRNREFFEGRSFLVAHADNLTFFDVEKFISRHEQRAAGVEITMMTFSTDTPESCGIVEEDENGIVIGFHEKVANPPGNHANGAVYIFEPTVIDFLAELGNPVIDLSTEVIPHYLGRMQTFGNGIYLRDIGTPESLALAEREVLTIR